MRIAYVGPFPYPSSGANALRVRGIADALVQAGHQIHICGGMPPSVYTPLSTDSDGIIEYCSEEYRYGLLKNISPGLRGVFIGDRTLEWLKSITFKPDLLMIYGAHLGYLARLMPYCRSSGIPLVLDIVEWYDPRSLPGGLLGPLSISYEISMRFLCHKADGVIAISSFLSNYFSQKGCQTTVVPPLFPLRQQVSTGATFRHDDGYLHLCYAGTPGTKDDLSSLYKGISSAPDFSTKIKVHIVGLTMEEFSRLVSCPLSSPILTEVFRFYGRISNQDATAVVSRCDFQVLLREDTRVSRAGFPSKIAESFSLGVPVIGNLTSDLGDYLKDGVNALIVPSIEVSDVASVLKRAICMRDISVKGMRDSAYFSAKSYFTPDSRRNQIDTFLRGLI